MDIQQTKAYRNAFFKLHETLPTKTGLRLLVQNWFPVTHAFCLSTLIYNGVLAKHILKYNEKTTGSLEQALLATLQIGGGEFAFGAKGLGAVHYRLFARLAQPLGLDFDDLRQTPFGTLPETRDLVNGIRSALSSVFFGAGCIRVVEATAYNIVEAMDRIFRGISDSANRPLFTDWHLEYITLHLELEKEHDSISTDFLTYVVQNDEQQKRVDDGISQISFLFGRFWERLDELIFPGQANRR